MDQHAVVFDVVIYPAVPTVIGWWQAPVRQLPIMAFFFCQETATRVYVDCELFESANKLVNVESKSVSVVIASGRSQVRKSNAKVIVIATDINQSRIDHSISSGRIDSNRTQMGTCCL
jgi:hypothetical protein